MNMRRNDAKARMTLVIWMLGCGAATQAEPATPSAPPAPVTLPPDAAGAGGPSAAGEALAGSLTGLRVEVPCKGPKFGENTECHWDPALLQTTDPAWKLKRELVRTFGGSADVTYAVTLRVRGVVEPKNFTGGKVEQEHFQSGGSPLSDDYNFYSIKVSDPAQSYTVNRHEQKTSHFVFPLDYTVTIPIRGGATVTVGAYDRNDISIANHTNTVVPELAPAPAAFDGQFFQIDVVGIAPQ